MVAGAMRTLGIVLLLAVQLAGCGEPALGPEPSQGPPPIVRRLEAESFARAGAVCTEGVDAVVGHLYQEWASEGLVVRLPRAGCSLEFDVVLPLDAEFRRFRVRGEAPGTASWLRVQVDGVPVAEGGFTPGAEPAVASLRGGLVPAGPHTVRVEYDAGAGAPAIELDYLEAESERPQVGGGAAPASSTDAPAPTATAIGRAGPLVLEGEGMDRADPVCDPDPDGERTRREERGDASGDAVIVLPRHGCGMRTDGLDLAKGRFTAFQASLRTGGDDAEVRLRVLLDGETVASAVVRQEAGAPQDVLFPGSFQSTAQVGPGRFDVRVDFQVVSGPRSTDVALDFVRFEPE